VASLRNLPLQPHVCHCCFPGQVTHQRAASWRHQIWHSRVRRQERNRKLNVYATRGLVQESLKRFCGVSEQSVRPTDEHKFHPRPNPPGQFDSGFGNLLHHSPTNAPRLEMLTKQRYAANKPFECDLAATSRKFDVGPIENGSPELEAERKRGRRKLLCATRLIRSSDRGDISGLQAGCATTHKSRWHLNKQPLGLGSRTSVKPCLVSGTCT
jgi:hypothetical protein